MKSCQICKKTKYQNPKKFKGSTKKYAKKKYKYAICTKCHSIDNLSKQEITYENYPNGKKKFTQRTTRFTKFLKQNKITKKHKILDYGCGSGQFTQTLKEKGYNVKGYEPHNTRFPLPKTKFDAIYLIHVLEHITNYSKLFKKLDKLIMKNGLIITIHPSSTRIKKLSPNNPSQSWIIHSPYHSCLPSDNAIIKLFNKNSLL